jgi:ABC-2 type transport system ATP-binding protein
MIQVEGLTKRYARHVAVKNISFEVGKGEIVGFLGKNGAGKTTTMRVLTCFLPPTEGKASVAGFDVLEESLEVRKNIGYLPETPPLYPEMEVGDYLAFVAKLKGIPAGDIPSRVDAVCESTGIAPEKRKIIGKLSKGYRQRVGIAQAIIHNPPVLILDEPTSGLDPEQQLQVRNLIASLSGDHTIILSTHILSEVEQSCSKVIIINNGEIIAVDTVANLQRRGSAAELVAVEVGGADAARVRQTLEVIQGVAAVRTRDSREGLVGFEVEGMEHAVIRPHVARAIVENGWNLMEMHALGGSLQDIFLEMTRGESQNSDSPKTESTPAESPKEVA